MSAYDRRLIPLQWDWRSFPEKGLHQLHSEEQIGIVIEVRIAVI